MKVSDELKVLLQRLDNIESVVNRIDRDLATDRKDLQSFTLRLGGVENQFEQLRSSVLKLPEKVQDRVAETSAPIVDQAKELTDTIAEKRVLILKETKGFWKRLFRR